MGERGEVRLFVSKLGIRVGGSLQMYETVQRQGDERLQRRNEGLLRRDAQGTGLFCSVGPSCSGKLSV